MKRQLLTIIGILLLLAVSVSVSAETPRLTISGNDFLDPYGNPVRFWGFNLVSLYPTHTQADSIANQLAGLGVNVVRPHHVNRDATYNWNYTANGGGGIGALINYNYNSNTTRTKNTAAYESFDYLNYKLKEKGIYTRMTLDGTRSYLTGDVDILATNPADRAAWIAAMNALNELQWDHARDLRRMLPTMDERTALLNIEFMTAFLNHENQYTGLTYAEDPQTLTLEVANETSAEYAFIMGNRFTDADAPSKNYHAYPRKSNETDQQLADRKAANEAALEYWHDMLNNKWLDYLTSIGVTGANQYSIYSKIEYNDDVRLKQRSDFLRKLDEDYFERIKALVRAQNCDIPITFSTFWRGDVNLNMHAEKGDYIEEHSYSTVKSYEGLEDLFGIANRQTKIDGMPYFIGELNQTEDERLQNIPARANLILETAVYGSFNNWTGINFFSWNHGDDTINPDGSAKNPFRANFNISSYSKDRVDLVGNMQRDQIMLDHMRTAGIIFKNELVSKSTQPKIVYIDEPYFTGGAGTLMTPKYQPKNGWQSIHAIFKQFTAPGAGVPVTQVNAPWMNSSPTQLNGQLISDTNEIIKDLNKKQLLVNAQKAAGFGGYTYLGEPVSLDHLEITNPQNGSATVIMVSGIEKPLSHTNHIIISNTAMSHSLTANMAEITGSEYALSLKVKSLTIPTKTQYWEMEITRPASLSGRRVLTSDQYGSIILPTDVSWNECELRLVETLSYSFIGAENGLSYNQQSVTGNLNFTNNFGRGFMAAAALYENKMLKELDLKPIGQGDNNITFGTFNISEQASDELATVTENYYNDTGLQPATGYEYVIQGYDGETPVGDPIIKQIVTAGEAETIPDTPFNLSAENISGGSVTLSWDSLSDSVYNIYRDGLLIGAGITNMLYTDNTAASSTAYTYKLTAVSSGGESGAAYINITTPEAGNLLYSLYKNGAFGQGLNVFGGQLYGGNVYSTVDVIDTPAATLNGEIQAGTKTLFVKTEGSNDNMVGPNINWQSTASGAKPVPVDFEGLIATASIDGWLNLQAVRNRYEIGLSSQKPGSNDIYHLRVSLSEYIETTGSTNVGYWTKWQHITVPLSDLIMYGSCYSGTNPLAVSQELFDWNNIIGVSVAVSNESGSNAMAIHDLKLISSPYNPPENINVAPASNLTATENVYNRVSLAWIASPDAAVIDGYRIYRNGTLLTPQPIQALSYTDNSVLENTSYNYVVKAVRGRRESAGIDISLSTPVNLNYLWQIYKLDGTGLEYGQFITSNVNANSPGTFTFTDNKAVANSDVVLPVGTKCIVFGPNATGVASISDYMLPNPQIFNTDTFKDLSGYINGVSLKAYVGLLANNGTEFANQDIKIGFVNGSGVIAELGNPRSYIKVSVNNYLKNVMGITPLWAPAYGDVTWYELDIPLEYIYNNGEYYVSDILIHEVVNSFDWSEITGITLSGAAYAGRLLFTDLKVETSNILPSMAVASFSAYTAKSSLSREPEANLTWEPIPNADSYKITRRGGSSGIKIFIWDDLTDIKPFIEPIKP